MNKFEERHRVSPVILSSWAICQDTGCGNCTTTSGSKFYAYYGIGISEAFRLFYVMSFAKIKNLWI